MRIVTEFPHRIRDIEHLWIPLADGTRLGARIWLPDGAGKVPAILEYIPYRKRDYTRRRDEPMHAYFAGRGYAAVRVDMRGSGESDGLLADEYLKLEQDDALEVIQWIASQSWCDGRVGMMGKSWGGFNALQVAARRPPALKAIITVCSTDDRYADDIHYMGGCVLNDNLSWGTIMLAFNARPPDPELVGEDWRRIWLDRLEHTPFFPALWLEHQWRDAYWRHGSVCEDYQAIACPVYAIGGWADGYSNAVPRLLAGLGVPRKGLIGPWAHLYAHDGVPGPAIGFLQEAVRWWDHWLKNKPTGIMDEPMLRVWMTEAHKASATILEEQGRWVAEAAWPSKRIGHLKLALAAGRLALAPAPESKEALVIHPCQSLGAACGEWSGFGVAGENPADQRADDAFSLVFDSDPLTERLEILGAPVVELELACDQPIAYLVGRLSVIATDGSVARLSYGVLNLTHRQSHAEPTPLIPGRRERARLQLNDLAYAFHPGERARLALSSGYWPTIWPAPVPARITLAAGAGQLILPVRPARAEDAELPAFEPPESAPPTPTTLIRKGHVERSHRIDLLTGEHQSVTDGMGGLFGEGVHRIDATGIAYDHSLKRSFRIHPNDPLSASQEIVQSYAMERGSWSTRIATRTAMRASQDAFILEGRLEAFEGDNRVFSRDWNRRIPRRLV